MTNPFFTGAAVTGVFVVLFQAVLVAVDRV
jgi:hypothetical protein